MPTRLPPVSVADAIRFDGLVDRDGGPDACWPFLGGLVAGYGSFRLGKRKVRAHRVAWVMWSGRPEPDGPLDHACHDPAPCAGPCLHRRCCNPRHLRPATDRESNAPHRRRTKAHRTHCARGHPRTPQNVRVYVSKTGVRATFCRTCDRESARARNGSVRAYGPVDPMHCRNGHPRTRSYVATSGKTVCRDCARAGMSRYKARHVRAR